LLDEGNPYKTYVLLAGSIPVIRRFYIDATGECPEYGTCWDFRKDGAISAYAISATRAIP
jgi:hypothetical protein